MVVFPQVRETEDCMLMDHEMVTFVGFAVTLAETPTCVWQTSGEATGVARTDWGRR